MKRLFPILTWIRNYSAAKLRSDALAGITVGVILVPQAMAYAFLAGLPPVYGLYAALVPLFIYATLGTSMQLAVGPVAIVSMLVAAGASLVAEPGTLSYIEAALMLAFLAGSFQFLMGILRLGFLVNFISHPVVTGFVMATAMLIAIGQIHHLFGVQVESQKQLIPVLLELYYQSTHLHGSTFLIGMMALFILFALKKWRKKWPGALMIMGVGIFFASLFEWELRGVRVLGDIPSGLPVFSVISLNWDLVRTLLPISLAIAVIGYVESIAVATSMQRRSKTLKVDTNKELVALGASNLIGSFFQAFPVAGGFSRSAVNEQSGAKTQVSGLVSASVVALVLLILTPVFYHLPIAILAAIIILAVSGLLKMGEVRFLWHTDKKDFLLMALTFVSTLFLGIELGLITGVLASVIVVLYNDSRPHYAELGKMNEGNIYRNVLRYDNLEADPDVLIFRFDAPVFYANAEYFAESLRRLIRKKGQALRHVILDAQGIHSMDTTGLHALKEIDEELTKKGISFLLSGVHGPVRDLLDKSSFAKNRDSKYRFYDIDDALDYVHVSLKQ